jgi:hypothetical protein
MIRHISQYWAIMVFLLVSSTASAQIATHFKGGTNALDPLWFASPGADYLGSGAAGVAETGLAVAAFVNPAGISSASPSWYLESAWRDRSNEYLGFTNDRAFLLPSFASIGIPLTFGSLQLGYAHPYYQNLSLPGIPVTTVDHPDGTGQFMTYVTHTEIHTAFAGIGISPLPSYSIGVSMGIDYVHRRSLMGSTTEVEVKGARFRSAVGVIAHPSTTTNVALAIRYASAKNLDLSGTFYDVGNPLALIPRYEARSPLEIDLGGAVVVSAWLTLLASAQLEDWSNVISGSHSIWQVRFGAEFPVFPSTVIRAGFFTQYSPIGGLADYFDQRFITLGCSTSVTSNLQLFVSLITSELLQRSVALPWDGGPGDSFSRSEVSLGVGFSI